MNGFRKDLQRKYIIGVDVGTTTVRACLFDEKCRIIAKSEKPVQLELSNVGCEGMRAEIDPDLLWNTFCAVCKEIIAGVDDVTSVASMGISCHRNSFICWNKDTGQPCHKLITWKDCRARQICKKWNASLLIKAMNIFGSVAHFFTRIQRFKAFRMFQFLGGFVTHRLMVTIQENAEMQNLLTSDKLMYGCLDTWLIHKLTKGAVHVTEPSNSSTTGLYDPYMMNWGHMLLRIISFPVSLLPKLTFSAGVPLATCHNEIFGFPLKIGSMAGDQQAALFGSGGWHKGDVNICIGTGAFLDLNTGQHPIASLNGLYPVLAWRFPHHYNFAAEGSSFETGSLVKWAQSIGLFDDIAQLPNITSKVSRTDLCFVPAFSGLQTPINDTTACCAFLGLRPNTTKEHMLIALLDSIAFRIYQIWNTLTDEIDFEVNNVIKCCGGVSSNDFICQTISTLINRPLQRLDEQCSTSARGVAMMAGITVGLWNKDDLYEMIEVNKTFNPNIDERPSLVEAFNRWQHNIRRSFNYYDNVDK